MRPTRHLLAITLVATALCADRGVAAAPILRPQVAGVAGNLVTRLSVRFKRVLPSARVYQTRRDGMGTVHLRTLLSSRHAPWIAPDPRLSPMVLYLPPPIA